VIYRTWCFFFFFASNIVFRSRSSQISRDLNVSADCISKLLGFDDYVLWGPRILTSSPVATTPSCLDLTIRFFQLGCEAPFSQNWGYDNNNWLCPPVCLIVRVIRYMKLCRTRETLVLSLWKAAFFWNAFNRNGVYWNSFVVNWVYLPKFQGLFVPAGLAIPFSNPGP